MKKLSSVLLVGTVIALVGCGGESNSSSGSEVDASNTVLGDFAVVYDNYPEPVDENSCSTDGRVVVVSSNNTCKVELSALNEGKTTTITCHDDNSISVGDGPKLPGGTMQLNGYYFACNAG